MKYYLIDYENVNAAGLDGIEDISADSRVVLFYTKNSSKIDLGVFNMLRSTEAELAVIEVHHGKQALDIQLGSYVGFLIGTEPVDTEYYIISKDKGYRNIMDFWSDRHIYLCTNLRGDSALIDEPAPAKPAPARKSPRTGTRSGSRGSRKTAAKSSASDDAKAGARSAAKSENKPEEKTEARSGSGNNPAADTKAGPASDGNAQTSNGNGSNGSSGNNGNSSNGNGANGGNGSNGSNAGSSANNNSAGGDSKPSAAARRNEVNTEIQKILSNAEFDGDVINATASFVARNIGKDGYKQLIYRGIIKERGQKQGLEIYRLIKGVL